MTIYKLMYCILSTLQTELKLRYILLTMSYLQNALML